MHVGKEVSCSHLQQHHQCSAHILPHIEVLIARDREQALQVATDMVDEGGALVEDELIDTSNGVGPAHTHTHTHTHT